MEIKILSYVRTLTDDGIETNFDSLVCRVDAGTVIRDESYPNGYVELEIPDVLANNEVILARFDAEQFMQAVGRALLNRDE